MSSNLIVNNIEVGAGATIYTAASNQLAFGTNGTEKVRIHSNGAVSVGGAITRNYYGALNVEKTATSSTAIDIKASGTDARAIAIGDHNTIQGEWCVTNNSDISFGTSTNHHLTFYTNGTSNERLRITSDGKFGLNTTAPYAYDTTATTLEVKGSVASAADTEVARFRGGSDANGGTAVLRLTNDNDRGLVVKGGRESDAEFAEFGVSAFNGSYTRGIRINSGGQILIGTSTNPAYTNRRLTVATTSGTTAIEVRSATNGDGRIYFTDNTTSGNVGAYAGKLMYDHTDNYMAFYTGGDDATPGERLRITSNGQVKLDNELRTNRIVPKDGLPSGSSGGIIQVKQVIHSEYIQYNSNSWSKGLRSNGSTGNFEITITPTRTDSKILVSLNCMYDSYQNQRTYVAIFRGASTNLGGGRGHCEIHNDQGRLQAMLSAQHLDSPNTTSPVTYTIQANTSTGSFYLGLYNNNKWLTAMEVTG